MIKRIWERHDLTYNFSYMLTVAFIFASVFGVALYMQISVEFFALQILAGVILPPLIAWFGLYDVLEDNRLSHNTVDKSLSKENRTTTPVIDLSPTTTKYYYPAVGVSLTPIFSVSAIFNTTTCIIGIAYFIGSFLSIFDLTLGLAITTAVAFGFSWLAIVALNIVSLVKISKARKKPSPYVIDMKYSNRDLTEAINNQAIIFYNNPNSYSGKKDLLKSIAQHGIDAARALNVLIAEGYTDAVVMSSEIKTIEYAINYFVITTISTTNKFFKKYKANPSEAKRVYKRDVEPSILKEALELDEKIQKIDKVIEGINTRRIESRRQLIEDAIVIDEDLIALTHRTQLPIVAFPDFHKLEFDDIERKVAAQRIVSGSLMNLVNARESTSDGSNKHKLNKKIEEVKNFVRSLASDTPESITRKNRISAKEKANILHLENDAVITGDIDNIIAITNRYIDSYDNTLPTNNS